MSRTSPIALATLALLACASEEPRTPDGWSRAAPLARVIDLDPDPAVIEIELVAAPARWTIAPGRSFDGYAYNGSVPGPLVEARAGDTLVVHFRNDLPEPTTIHWHGVRLPADQDGGPHSQAPVPPGGTFEYRFALIDPGTFWYHPHLAEASQMERGLYGAIVVRGADEPEVDTETVVMLDDVTLDASGELAPFGSFVEDHGGREGAIQLINGTITPSVPVRAGERQRWRIVNAGSARFYRLSLGGASMTVLGTDVGRASAPSRASELFLVPGDRVDIVLDIAGAPGSSLTLSNERYLRGHGNGVYAAYPVATLAIEAREPLPPRAPIEWSAPIDPIEAGAPSRELVFDETVDDATETVTFTINGESYPDVTMLESRVGATEVWDLVNESEMDHPFHLHGFFFQVLSRDGVAEPSPSWEDTIHLPGSSRARIAFRVEDRPGMWMFHCHILEHVEHGMMGALDVAP